MKILLTINKKDVKVSPEEARKLYDELSKLFNPPVSCAPTTWISPHTISGPQIDMGKITVSQYSGDIQ